jgi:hypothetical protein
MMGNRREALKMISRSSDAIRTLAGTSVDAGLIGFALPSIQAVARIVHAGGILGGVAGLVSGGVKCLHSLDPSRRNVTEVARVLGRDVASGIASGAAASAASLYISAAGATIGTVLSAPAWVPSVAATAAAIGIGYVTAAASQEVWGYCEAYLQSDSSSST